MTQEMGSLGKDVALGVCDALGLKQVRDDISEHVAHRLHKRKSALGRYLEGQAGLIERAGLDQRTLAIVSAEEVYQYAVQDNVLIRGWGAVYLLAPVSHVLRVRVCAPFERRVRWLMERLHEDRQLAEEEIRRSDAAHAANIRRWFDKSFGDPLDYDLVLNTGTVSVKSCAETIKLMVRRPEYQPTAASRAKIAGLALQACIRVALEADPATAQLRITIDVDGGDATLSGIVVDESESQACERVVTKVPGVAKVTNALKTMQGQKLFRQ
jgi:cytidylate kinase